MATRPVRNDDTPIFSGVTSEFNAGGASMDPQPGKGLSVAERRPHRVHWTGSWVMDAGSEILVGGPVTLDQWQVHSFVFNGANSEHYIDGELAASGDSGPFAMDDPNFWSTDGGWHRAGNLDFAEGLFYNEVLGSDDRAGLEQYLSNKWGFGALPNGDFNNDDNGTA